MKNKIVLSLAAFAVAGTMLMGVAPASAADAPPQVIHESSSGSLAGGIWFTDVGDDLVVTVLRATQSRPDREFSLFQITFTGEEQEVFTVTSADVTSGFSFSIDPAKLASARVIGSNMPGTTCTHDIDFNVIACDDTTIDVDASWSAVGALRRLHSGADVYQDENIKVVRRFEGLTRNATATAVVNGLALGSSEEPNTDLGILRGGYTTICFGNDC
jgi:hypothetical protein